MSSPAYNTGGDAPRTTEVGASTGHAEVQNENVVHRAPSGSSYAEEKVPVDEEKGGQTQQYVHRASDEDAAESKARRAAFYKRFRPLILAGVAAVILGWWISSTILKATRHRWCVVSIIERLR